MVNISKNAIWIGLLAICALIHTSQISAQTLSESDKKCGRLVDVLDSKDKEARSRWAACTYIVDRYPPAAPPAQLQSPTSSPYKKAFDDIFYSSDYYDAKSLGASECFKKNQDNAKILWLIGNNLPKVYSDFQNRRYECSRM